MVGRVFMVCAMALLLVACGGSAFSILKEQTPDSEGFLSPDVLQVVSIGYPAWNEKDPARRKLQARQAAETMARLRAVEFLLGELQNESAEKYQAVVMKIGSRLAAERYEPIFGDELTAGRHKADGYFDLLSLTGYPQTNWYTPQDGCCQMVYRVVKAGLIPFGRNGFGMYP